MKRNGVKRIIAVLIVVAIAFAVYFVKIAPLLASPPGCYCYFGTSRADTKQQCSNAGGTSAEGAMTDCSSKPMCSGPCYLEIKCQRLNSYGGVIGNVYVSKWAGNSVTITGECKNLPTTTSRPTTRPATETQPVGGGGG